VCKLSLRFGGLTSSGAELSIDAVSITPITCSKYYTWFGILLKSVFFACLKFSGLLGKFSKSQLGLQIPNILGKRVEALRSAFSLCRQENCESIGV